MGVTNSNKRINADRIECDGSLKVTLALTAAPDIVSNPTDIVLVLDRSGSMAGEPLAAMKAGSRSFIDIIAEATGGAPGQIGAGSRGGGKGERGGKLRPMKSGRGAAEKAHRSDRGAGSGQDPSPHEKRRECCGKSAPLRPGSRIGASPSAP